MTCIAIMADTVCSISARARAGFFSVLFCTGIAYTLGGGSVAHAVMGESAENRGLVLADEKVEVLLACALGAACRSEDNSFFRELPANQIVRDAAVIERGITIPPTDPPGTGRIGFGSLLSTADAEDTFCWTGLGQRQCVEISEVGTPGSVSGAIIQARIQDPSECADAEALFGQPPNTFDYLVRFDTSRFGLGDAVVVVTCADVAAAPLILVAESIHEDVGVMAHRSMSAYDALRFGGGYCCR